MPRPEHQQPVFAGACRRFLLGMADALAVAGADTVPPRHAEACARCRGHWQAARRQETALRAMASLRAPVVLGVHGEDSTLAAIHARVVARAEHSAGNALAESFAPSRAPRDVEWRVPTDTPWFAAALRRMERRAAPGWMWRRIRGELTDSREVATATSEARRRAVSPWRRRPRLAWAAAAAAVLLGVTLFLTTKQGTAPGSDLVWIITSDPAELSLSSQRFMELGR